MSLDEKSPWPKFRRNAAQNSRRTQPVAATRNNPWQFQVAPAGGIFSSPVIDGAGRIYVGAGNGYFYCLSRAGKKIWRYPKDGSGGLIDSSALLDDRGRVYFGAGPNRDGDCLLLALDRTQGAEVWRFKADPARRTESFVDWFEGNVGINAKGELIVPNDNFRIYLIEREHGKNVGSIKLTDQTWALPAVGRAHRLYVANNTMLPQEPNIFEFREGVRGPSRGLLRFQTKGSVVASPMLGKNNFLYVGSFDGYLYAFDLRVTPHSLKWTFATRDHIYASPAELSDGTIIQASTDGSIYALEPLKGELRWQFDTLNPIRSSPAVDAGDNIYIGSGDGRLLVLAKDGCLKGEKWLVTTGRRTVNSSPALGETLVAIGDSAGSVHGIPYHKFDPPPADPKGAADPAASFAPTLLHTDVFGVNSTAPPAEIVPNDILALTLSAKDGGHATLALIDHDTVKVQLSNNRPVRARVSGDRHYLVIRPMPAYADPRGGEITISITYTALVDPERDGLRFTGGRPAGTFTQSFRTTVQPADGPETLPLSENDFIDFSRLSAPLPTLMPSYNQIGFENLSYHLGVITRPRDSARPHVFWMIGRKLVAAGAGADPDTHRRIPFVATYALGVLTLQATNVVSELNGFRTRLSEFAIATRFGTDGRLVRLAPLLMTFYCKDVEGYGTFLEKLGAGTIAWPIELFGAAGATVRSAQRSPVPASFTTQPERVIADVAAAKIDAGRHCLSILLTNVEDDLPVAVDYSYGTTYTLDPSRSYFTTVSLDVGPEQRGRRLRAYLILDVLPVKSDIVTLPP